MSRPRLLVDATQYVSWPATSGAQRVLLHIATRWAGTGVDAHFGFIEDSAYVIGPLETLGVLIRSTFEGTGPRLPAEEARQELRTGSCGNVGVHEVEGVFDAYLLPEPTLRRESLAVAERLRSVERFPSFFIYYDAIPLTDPGFFPKGTDSNGSVTHYHQVLSAMSDVAFISAATRGLFERRIARRMLENCLVVSLGADGLPRLTGTRPDRPTFTILGTVEPRKRHAVVLDAFETLWAAGREYRLVVLGAPGSGQPELLERLRSLSSTPLLDWTESPSDHAVAGAIARSCAALFVPSVEGSGLPALEALALGCPVVVSSDLPALEGLGDAGQIRLEQVDAESVAVGVETLAEPTANDEYRAAIRDLRLPTWASFVAAVEAWITDRVVQGVADSTDLTRWTP